MTTSLQDFMNAEASPKASPSNNTSLEAFMAAGVPENTPVITESKETPIPAPTDNNTVTTETPEELAAMSPIERMFSDRNTEAVYKSFENIGIPMRTIQEMPNKVMSEWMGEIASIPAALKGAEFAAKLPIGHPLLKTLAIAATSATSAGIAQAFGELGEDVWQGKPADYRNALEEGVRTAKWDAAGGLVIKGVGFVSRKALATAGIKDKDDAVTAARELLQKYGADLTWFQTTGSKLSSTVEGIARAGIGGTEMLKKVGEKQLDALSQHLNKFFTDTSKDSASNLGIGIKQIYEDSLSNLSKSVGPRYTAIYEASESIPVNLREYTEGVYAQVKRAGGARKDPFAKSANKFVNDVNDIVMNLKPATNMADLNTNISQLKAIKRAGNDRLAGEEGRAGAAYAEKEIKKLNGILDNATEKLAPDLKKQLDALNKEYAIVKSRLSSETMKTAIRKDPSQVAKWAYGNPDKTKDFYKFMAQARNSKAITPEKYKEVIADFKSSYVETLLKSEGASLQDMAKLGDKLGKSAERNQLKTVLGRADSNRLMSVLKVAKMTSDRANSRFSLVVGSQQMTNLKQLALGGLAYADPMTALMVLTSPMALAKAASSAKTMGEWLTHNQKMRNLMREADEGELGLMSNRIAQWTTSDNKDKETK